MASSGFGRGWAANSDPRVVSSNPQSASRSSPARLDDLREKRSARGTAGSHLGFAEEPAQSARGAYADGVLSHADKRALRRELRAAGVFEPRPVAAWLKFVAMLTALGALLAAVIWAPTFAALLLVPVAAVAAATAAMLGHEAAHGSFARSKWHNAFALHVAFPLFSGLGALHWQNKHNRLHHSHPNVPGVDYDIELWPFAVSADDYARSGPVRRRMQRSVQAYLFWPSTLLLAFLMRIASIVHLMQRARRRGFDRACAADAACMTAHYALWLVVPSLLFGALPVILLYVGLWSVVGLLLAMIFAPAHMGLPLVRKREDVWLHQLETTRNLRMPRWLSWMVIGLDHQVEHHLFPQIPHQQMGRASLMIRRFCHERGAPYQEIGYGAGIAEVTRFLATSWRYDPDAPGVVPIDPPAAPVASPR